MSKRGRKPVVWTEDDYRRVESRFSEGATVATVREEMGVSQHTFERLLMERYGSPDDFLPGCPFYLRKQCMASAERLRLMDLRKKAMQGDSAAYAECGRLGFFDGSDDDPWGRRENNAIRAALL